jgi:aldehyde dehydrogenase (NAD+)
MCVVDYLRLDDEVAAVAAGDSDPRVIVGRLRHRFDTGTTRELSWRRSQLKGLRALILDNRDEIVAALRADLGKSEMEVLNAEIGPCKSDIDYQLKKLERWARPRRVAVPARLQPGRAVVRREPLGVVMIIGPWNYPIQLILMPLAAALAAGNVVVVKPSEHAPATGALLADLLPRYVDHQAVAMVLGGPDETQAMLAAPLDHIFFTGSPHVGRAVAAAAATQLTPVTLELGGKSPAIVTRDANLQVAARRIALAKFLNAGQTCIAPDYLLVESSVTDALVDHLRAAINDFYGPDPALSGDFGRIVNGHHVARLEKLITGAGAGHVVAGGKVDHEKLYVAPTLLVDTDPDAPVMKEEIFGPVLPILPVDNLENAIEFINERPKPLALYVFSRSNAAIERVLASTSSGGACVNATLFQLGPHELPLGGVGLSGTGSYHGEAGFRTFSHEKSVFYRPVRPDLGLLYPPSTKSKLSVARRIW